MSQNNNKEIIYEFHRRKFEEDRWVNLFLRVLEHVEVEITLGSDRIVAIFRRRTPTPARRSR